MERRQFLQAGLVSAASGMSGAALAQAWPGRPIKWILSQPAGSGPDILARFVADNVSRRIGQPIVVDNRPGGQNVIGAQAAMRSPADGYTFYYATTAAMVTNVFTFKALPYDPEKDFTPVRLIGRSPFVIAAGSSFGGASLADAIAAAKSQPEKLAIATEGPKTFSGMLADSFAAMAGIKFTHVPYNKAPDAIQDVIGGRVDFICLPEAALLSYIRSGQIKALAVSTAQRTANLPSVPTLSETFSGFEYSGWNGLFAPAGTPKDIVDHMSRELEVVLKQPDVVQRLQTLGSLAETKMSVAEFEVFMRSERTRWAGIVKAIGIKPE
ncbi:LacI family transcriptional regulator [Limnohabitans sp. TS-CS-82]|uniref:Bug family tripartite tricarboxylate transporter substrate binding protein n=1 Tax=Limnohabitans sp. TS-CS-82 TaxID=2094193 RepID=UPI000CF1F87F|nr:tripartite tricarboxylate transporter substrate-binding protein [Limnohabitans sp. TS-CS-82]PQA83121.1 LacI family transcriptional regulator [Limnohabitans sp. TS-CS-82]